MFYWIEIASFLLSQAFIILGAVWIYTIVDRFVSALESIAVAMHRDRNATINLYGVDKLKAELGVR